jgi:DNA polymerase III subunit chi
LIVDFYHLSSSPVERVLPRICERLIETRDRLLVVADAPLSDLLDTLLWTQSRTSFLPHGLAADANAAAQPILLSTEAKPLNGARNIALADGCWRHEALDFDRIFHFFTSEQAETARDVWRTLGARHDIERRYWRQQNGKWQSVA